MSNIKIYGSTGMVGQALTEEAVRRGHNVTAISRSENPQNEVEGATYVTGDISNIADVKEKAADADVLIFSVPGARDGSSVQPIIDAHKAIIDALANEDVRLFIVGGAGALTTDDGTKLVDTPDFPEAYATEARSFAQILDLYRNAPQSLNWVMLAPSPTIEPGAATDSYVLGDDHPAGDHVTTGTFAQAALDEIEQPTHTQVRFTVADSLN